jgi:hypothetical protein
MKKNLLYLIVAVFAVGIAFYVLRSQGLIFSSDDVTTTLQSGPIGSRDSSELDGGMSSSAAGINRLESGSFRSPEQARPAAEVYSNAADALAAIKLGAANYDDVLLDQFTTPGEDCTWCPEFYSSLTELMKAGTTSIDERSYYAEILAISGKQENIQTLLDAIRESGDSEDADIYAEALELTIGGDDVVKMLSSYLQDSNELLQESVVAAITNQGSRAAAELLYEHTVAMGDPDGYYSVGIGLGEMIPEEETLPFLQDLMLKRDEYSPLAVKALLNSGLDGLVLVVNAMTASPAGTFSPELLEDATDHVSYDDETIEYLKQLAASSPHATVRNFAADVLKDFDEYGVADDDDFFDDYDDDDDEDDL